MVPLPQITSLWIVLAYAFAAINCLTLRLPAEIGILVVSLLATLILPGMDGGNSVALALPESEWKPTILTATYVIVVFSIVVQGLTVTRVARWFAERPAASAAAPGTAAGPRG